MHELLFYRDKNKKQKNTFKKNYQEIEFENRCTYFYSLYFRIINYSPHLLLISFIILETHAFNQAVTCFPQLSPFSL